MGTHIDLLAEYNYICIFPPVCISPVSFLLAVLIVSVICRFRRVLGLCYVVVKVMLLVVIEVGVFPVICGWWLDICSLVGIHLNSNSTETRAVTWTFRVNRESQQFLLLKWLINIIRQCRQLLSFRYRHDRFLLKDIVDKILLITSCL